MGSWGFGLYDSDRACDLRASLKAVCRLPLDGPELLRVLLENEGPPDETFWLVTADQFHKKGVVCPEARDRALTILEKGQHPALAEQIRQHPDKKRTTLIKPQPLLMQAGEVLIYPTQNGAPPNPYLKHQDWHPDGWAALVVAEAEQLFGYLAWYRPAVAQRLWTQPPGLAEVKAVPDWRLSHAATCSSSHYQRLAFQSLGRIQLAPHWDRHLNERMMTGRSAALSDVSISNRMKVDARETFGKLNVGTLLI